jgi:hypothetical protein
MSYGETKKKKKESELFLISRKYPVLDLQLNLSLPASQSPPNSDPWAVMVLQNS